MVADAVFIIVFAFILKVKSRKIVPIKDKIKDHWFVLPILLVVALQLLSIRYFYTGPVQTIKGPVEVENSTYLYPYYSDEWVTVSLVKYTISSHALPVVNPLNHDKPFPDVLFVFPSTISEFFLITGLDPLTNYYILQMLVTFVCLISFYLLLRMYDVNRYISAVTILGFSYITNSGNLPAMWSLLPVSLSLVFLPWIIMSQKQGMKNRTLVYSLISLIIYPPIIIFVLPILAIDLYKNKNKKHTLKVFLVGVGSFILIFCVTFFYSGLSLGAVFSKYLIRSNLDPGIPDYFVWNILPVFIVLLSIYGIYLAIRKKYIDLLVPFFVGVIFWSVYLFVNKVFIIEYPRIVLIVSAFLIIFAGIGLESLIKDGLDKNLLAKIKIKNIEGGRGAVYLCVGIFFVALSLVSLSTYASQTSWKKLNLKIYDVQGKSHLIMPASPINRYLQSDDLKVFNGLQGINFLSIPWKGLVVGVAAGNFPLESKSSTISNQILQYSMFMSMNCEDKVLAAVKYRIQYVYSAPFSCPKFLEIGKSEEGFVLSSYIH